MIVETISTCSPEEVDHAKVELLQIFGPMGGVTARATDFSRILPGCDLEAVNEALEALVEDGSVDVASLSDGVAIYQFVRH